MTIGGFVNPKIAIHIPCALTNNKNRRLKMKRSLLVGTMLGIVTATALYCGMSNNSMRKAKRAFVNKIEDIIM